MLLSLVTPYNVATLLKLLLICDSDAKIHIIRILDGLRRNKLPVELFNKAAEPYMKAILAGAEKFAFFEHVEDSYCQLLYHEAGKVTRLLELSKPSQQGHRKEESNYAVCRLLLKLAAIYQENAIQAGICFFYQQATPM